MDVTFERVAPVFPVRSVTAAIAHYRKLGFEVDAYGETAAGEPIYAFAKRGAIELHLARTPTLDPHANTSACYVYVDDADALFAAWEAADAGGRLRQPVDTPYALRELTYVDPDGNLLRIGSPITERC
jgi:hypothetical protein